MSRTVSILRNITSHTKLGFALALAFAATACVAPAHESNGSDEAAEGPVAEASSALTALGYFTHQSSAAALPINLPIDLGPSSDRTCFLQGITGEFAGAQFGTPAQARVFVSNGRWLFQTSAGNGSGVKGFATCIPVTTNRRFLGWPGNTSDGENKRFLSKDSMTSVTQCFLTEVAATTGFQSFNAGVSLRGEMIAMQGTTFGTWTLGGHLVLQQDGSAGGRATAVCLDLFGTVSPYSHESPEGSSGTEVTLAPLADEVCSVQRLVGHFAGDVFGINDGAKLFREDGNWKAFSSFGKRIRGNCYGNFNFGL